MAVSLALLHHANQYLITDGYEHREGISTIIGSETAGDGILGVLTVHEAAGVPVNLHISGTLLEAIAWHSPSAIHKLRHHLKNGLIELIGSSYGQNIMRFFGRDYNRRQIDEQLRLYESLLGVQPTQVNIFWPPERVWDTRRMAPVLRDPTLLNGGYQYVVLDDRTLLSPNDANLPRDVYDKDGPWTPELYQTHEIENGLGLTALPIAVRLRQSIPPKKDEDWDSVQTELETLLVHASHASQDNLLALYADDMEKVIGVWGIDGPKRYAEFLQWVRGSTWIEAVKLSHWLQSNPPVVRKEIETGTFSELANEFNAGEGYEKWFFSENWAPYREYFERTERRVQECRNSGTNQSLLELAEKQLLVSNWETAWHTPATGAHGDPQENGKPSPWARALTSHCRHALVTADAACWMVERDGQTHAQLRDVDLDGEPDLVLKNDLLFGVISPRWGGRLVLLFYLGTDRGALVVGNPCDDWNYLEDLNRFMHAPRNHPGAFADVGFEDDRYECRIHHERDAVRLHLSNTERSSAAFGLEKIYELRSGDSHITVRYKLPPPLKNLSVESALSPDYLALLRRGSSIMTVHHEERTRGFEACRLAVVVDTDDRTSWETPLQEWIGHGRTVRVGSTFRDFELRLRVTENAAIKEAA